MWTVQRKDGAFNWLRLNQPPMEFDEHYGVTLAALAVGVAPEGYAKTPSAQHGIERLRVWLKANPPKNLHHQMMLLWVSSYLTDFQTPADQKATIKQVLAKQLPNGGWSACSLGDWKRKDNTEQTPDLADGYGAVSRSTSSAARASRQPIPPSARASPGSRPTSVRAAAGSRVAGG